MSLPPPCSHTTPVLTRSTTLPPSSRPRVIAVLASLESDATIIRAIGGTDPANVNAPTANRTYAPFACTGTTGILTCSNLGYSTTYDAFTLCPYNLATYSSSTYNSAVIAESAHCGTASWRILSFAAKRLSDVVSASPSSSSSSSKTPPSSAQTSISAQSGAITSTTTNTIFSELSLTAASVSSSGTVLAVPTPDTLSTSANPSAVFTSAATASPSGSCSVTVSLFYSPTMVWVPAGYTPPGGDPAGLGSASSGSATGGTGEFGCRPVTTKVVLSGSPTGTPPHATASDF